MQLVLITLSALLAVLIFSFCIVSKTYAGGMEQNLGDYKIINIADVPHLQDKEGFFIFPAFCPTACSVSWVKSEAPPPAPVVPQAPVTDNTTTSGNSTNDNATTASLNNARTYAPQRADGPFNEECLIGAIKVEFTKAGVYHFPTSSNRYWVTFRTSTSSTSYNTSSRR